MSTPVWSHYPLVAAEPEAQSWLTLIDNLGRSPATVADQISLLLDAAGYRAMLRESKAETAEDKLENVQELIGLAGDFHTARELLDHAALSTSGPQDESADRVRLMTMHKGKGLEFPHVFLPGWEAGTFPPDYGEISEERRLGHVAITRGMRRVSITHCEFRRGYTVPSSFIDDLPAENRVSGWLRGRADPFDKGRQPPRLSQVSISALAGRR
jgi:DNA helicase II / ATP-dependent DNA helicase PcrA